MNHGPSLRTARLVIAWLGAAACLVLAPEAARAHAPSNATLTLSADGHMVEQRWDIALRDLDRVLVLDADDDGAVTWGELRAAWPQVTALADAGLSIGIAGGASCTADAQTGPRIDDHADGTYAVIERRWQCPTDAGAQGLVIDYRLFAQSDASHRGLLQWRPAPGAAAATAVLAPDAGPKVLAGRDGVPAGESPSSSPFAGFVAEGIRHILIGTDHVLFLLALMLPAVLVTPATEGGGWRDAVWRVAQVVTAFTVAHSITLALAVLGLANPPSRLVESLIAASVVLAAADNLRRFLPAVRWLDGAPGAGVPAPPAQRVRGRFAAAVRWCLPAPGAGVPPPPAQRVIGRFAAAVRWCLPAPGAGVPAPPAQRVIGRFGAAVRWPMAFLFGLVHGFGFAGALKELALEPGALARSLVGFNLGVEIGQLGIVAIALPLAWRLRETLFYRRIVLAGGSTAIAAVAALWFAERAFDLRLIT